jgi:hypothetical protein
MYLHLLLVSHFGFPEHFIFAKKKTKKTDKITHIQKNT